MVLTQSEETPLGMRMPDIALPDVVTGRTWTFDDAPDAEAYVVMFLCNHCPYVQAVEDRLLDLARRLQPRGAAFVAVMPNDPSRYPDDHPDKLAERARQKDYPFPYLYDETQGVAKVYGAVCTPDLYVLDNQRRLAYRGRLDDSWKEPTKVTRHELEEAIEAVLRGKSPNPEQIPSMGCSIKWR
jgi:peroxiredoxin